MSVQNPRTYRDAYRRGEGRMSLTGAEARTLVDGINNLRGTLLRIAALEQAVQAAVQGGDTDTISEARVDLFEYVTTRVPVLLAETTP